MTHGGPLLRARLVPPSVRRALLGFLLVFAQVACQNVQYLTPSPGQVRVEEASIQPQFVTRRASLPASVRYWSAQGGSVDARWAKISAGESCDLCGSCVRGDGPGVPTESPDVLVMRRELMSEAWEETARLGYRAGCGSEPSAAFVPPASADYAVALQFRGDPIPTPAMGESGTRLMLVPAGGITLPLRLLTKDSNRPNTWTWRLGSVGTTHIKEAFDPSLHVARVRIVQATCSLRGADPRVDECGEDQPMDEKFQRDNMGQFVYVVLPVSVVAGDPNQTHRKCSRVPQSAAGYIEFGQGTADSPADCRPEAAVFYTPAYQVSPGATDSGTTPWFVEFSPEVVAGFSPDILDEQHPTKLWIEFSLAPLP